MADLEEKMLDSKREMQIADALDEIRTRNARIERNEARAEDSALATVAQKKLDEEAANEAAKQAWIEEGAAEARQNFKEIQRQALAKQAAEEDEIIEVLPPSPPKPWSKTKYEEEARAEHIAWQTERESNGIIGAMIRARRLAREAAREEKRNMSK